MERRRADATARMRRGVIGCCGLGLATLALLVSAPAALAVMAAPTGYTWSGQTPTTTSGYPNWSKTSNWQGGAAPSGTGETITFPDLSGTAACTASPPTEACYSSNNDLGVNTVNASELLSRTPTPRTTP